jgi:hypothetical protein
MATQNKKVILGLLLLTGCSTEQLNLATSLISKLEELNNRNKPVVAVLATPTVSPTPIIEDVQNGTTEEKPTESKVRLPPCGKLNANDGFKRGFTYKPNSDTQNWATTVLPEGIGVTDSCKIAGLEARNKGFIGGENGTEKRAVHILDGWTGQKLKEKHGAIKVRCGCYNWSIPDPSKRFD